MVFSDLFFLFVFLTSCIALYFIIPLYFPAPATKLKVKNIVLIVFSLIFYAWGEPVYVALLLLSTLVNYMAGLFIEKYRDSFKAKCAITLAVVFDIALLFVFKYTGFFVENINSAVDFVIKSVNSVFTADIRSVALKVPNIRLPIGISFFTFQIMSYVIDCYWEKVEVQKSYFKLLLYISLFPQLVAGPIVRYSTVEEEINDRTSTLQDVSEGLSRFIIGLSKKVIFANGLYSVYKELLGVYSDSCSYLGVALAQKSFFATVVGVICFALYVYYDFSGYSDMAIGMGRIFGFHFDENFKYPFISKNITEFWQRWHISLGSFFRDYLLYVPIFGKRRKYFNLFLVWFCTGFWHGASWNFILWGLYFGVFVFIEQLIGKKRMKKIPLGLTNLYALVIIVIGFGIFYFENLQDLGTFFKNLLLLNDNRWIDRESITPVVNNIYLIVAAIIFSTPVLPYAKLQLSKYQNNTSVAIAASCAKTLVSCFLLLICAVLLSENTTNPFLYFRF